MGGRLPDWSGDGLDVQHPLSIRRIEKCKALLKSVGDAGAVLVRAPPSSGKTAMAVALADYARLQGMRVHNLNLLTWDKAKHKTVRDVLQEKYDGFNILRALDQAQRPCSAIQGQSLTLFLLDEIQLAYDVPDDPFWHRIKELMQTPKAARSGGIICFGSYGESPSRGHHEATSTPVEFNSTYGLPFLRFTMDEWRSVVARYNAHATTPLSDAACALLFRRTSGHCSFSCEALRYLNKTLKEKTEEANLLTAILGGGMMAVWHSNRALRNTLPNLTADTKAFLRSLLSTKSRQLYLNGIGEEECPTATSLLRSGILCEESEALSYGFAAPVVVSILIGTLLAGHYKPPPRTVTNFVRQLLECFSRRQLDDPSNGSIDGRIYERAFRMEFFRCAYQALGSAVGLCHAEVGRLYGAKNYLDFYINADLQWGFELRRDAKRLPQEGESFALGGPGAEIPFKAFNILHFCYSRNLLTLQRFPRVHRADEIRIFYERNCPFVMVRFGRSNERPTKIMLLND